MPEVTAWQNRPLEGLSIRFHGRNPLQGQGRPLLCHQSGVCCAGDHNGRHESEHESSKFWLNVLNDLKNRGLDVYLFCTDGLRGMLQAIEAVYPNSQLQRCSVHQIRSSIRYVSWKDIKAVAADLKKIYTAVNAQEAEQHLVHFAETWRQQYPSCVKSWEEKWDVLVTVFEYPSEIRKIIYTTNIIEGLNRQFRQITKNKPSFMGDDPLRRMLYLASQRIMKHWHTRCRDWDKVLSQLQILFPGRAAG